MATPCVCGPSMSRTQPRRVRCGQRAHGAEGAGTAPVKTAAGETVEERQVGHFLGRATGNGPCLLCAALRVYAQVRPSPRVDPAPWVVLTRHGQGGGGGRLVWWRRPAGTQRDEMACRLDRAGAISLVALSTDSRERTSAAARPARPPAPSAHPATVHPNQPRCCVSCCVRAVGEKQTNKTKDKTKDKNETKKKNRNARGSAIEEVGQARRLWGRLWPHIGAAVQRQQLGQRRRRPVLEHEDRPGLGPAATINTCMYTGGTTRFKTTPPLHVCAFVQGRHHMRVRLCETTAGLQRQQRPKGKAGRLFRSNTCSNTAPFLLRARARCDRGCDRRWWEDGGRRRRLTCPVQPAPPAPQKSGERERERERDAHRQAVRYILSGSCHITSRRQKPKRCSCQTPGGSPPAAPMAVAPKAMAPMAMAPVEGQGTAVEGQGKAVEGRGKAVERQWKVSAKAVQRQCKGSGKAVQRR